MKEITIQEALDMDDCIFIDVRSPSEYMESHIPGSVNLPIFSDEERVQVGTTYKVQGQDPAKWLGMQLVSPKIPDLMESIKKYVQEGRKPVIYCWRGGMRSKAITSFAEMAGLDVSRLTGGFRSYRQWVVENLKEDLLPQQFVVLHGMTGVGKTTILHKLQQKGFPILDLEKYAGHRGSVFGGIGNREHNQKTFESLLLHDLKRVAGLPYVFMEAESKRIGKAVQPEFLLEAKKKGMHILLEASVEIRVKRIYNAYVQPNLNQANFHERVTEAIQPILKRFTAETKAEVLRALEQRDYENLISTLLNNYYDPRYRHKLKEYEGPFHIINADDVDQAVQEISEWVSNQFQLAENK